MGYLGENICTGRSLQIMNAQIYQLILNLHRDHSMILFEVTLILSFERELLHEAVYNNF